jgi:hypothetical protein
MAELASGMDGQVLSQLALRLRLRRYPDKSRLELGTNPGHYNFPHSTVLPEPQW